MTLAALPGAASAGRPRTPTAFGTHANSMATSAKVATVVPATTKAVAAANIATVTTSGKTMTITLTTTAPVKIGDIIVAGMGKATPGRPDRQGQQGRRQRR